MEEYRKEAHSKYLEQKKIENENENKKKYFEEMIQKSNLEFLEIIFNNITTSFENIMNYINGDFNHYINTLQETILSNIEFIKQMDKMDKLKEMIVEFVEKINSFSKRININIDNIKLLSKHLTIIFNTLNLDISIEEMDTNQDYLYALQLQQELFDEEN
jgi:primosomal protein N''